MATIKDIANRLGIAVSTVSKGLNGASDISEETRQLVLDTAVEMGYAARRVQKLGTRKVCIFIENMEYSSAEQFGYEIIVGFKRAAARQKCEVDIITTNLNMQMEERFDTYMLKHGYCGAFLLGFGLHEDYIDQLHKTTVPTVLLDNYISNPHVGYVGTDGFYGLEQAVSHLSRLGHRRIALLNGAKNSMVTRERDAAFRRALKRCGLPVHDGLVQNGWFVPDCAKDYVSSFLRRGATSVVCASDLIASGVVAELKRLGRRIPEDVSVIGFDDLPLAQRLSPALTTIRQDRVSLGRSAFMVLEELIGGVRISRLLLMPELVVRDSTAAAPGCAHPK